MNGIPAVQLPCLISRDVQYIRLTSTKGFLSLKAVEWDSRKIWQLFQVDQVQPHKEPMMEFNKWAFELLTKGPTVNLPLAPFLSVGHTTH